MLNVVDEVTRECLKFCIARPLKVVNVVEVLSNLFILRGVREHVHSDSGPEFTAKIVRDWITAIGAKTAYIAPGSPWENGFVESWRRHYNTERPHGSLGNKPPVAAGLHSDGARATLN